MLSIDSITDPKRMALLKKLEWRVRHAANSVLGGEYRSTFRGKGMEFDQVVPYAYGDDVRDIDWNVTARLGEPYRKKFIEEREVTLLIVFQDSVSLKFGSGGKTKRDALLELAVCLMLLGAVNRDRTALYYAGPQHDWYIEPAAGRGKIYAAASQLLAQQEPALDAASDVQLPWKFLSQAVPRHSVCLWLGDFPYSEERPSGWPILSKRYQMMGFRVEDPWERRLPDVGEISAYDPVTGDMAVVHPADTSQRKVHAQWVVQRDAYFKSLYPDMRSCMTLSNGDDVFDCLVHFLARRSLGGRM
ncbi:MAG: DUF58 domain-containing protein [Verrucomicrobiota bacterium]